MKEFNNYTDINQTKATSLYSIVNEAQELFEELVYGLNLDVEKVEEVSNKLKEVKTGLLNPSLIY